MSPIELLLVTGIVAVQWLGGALWWWLLRRDSPVSGVELLGMGLAIGTIASTLTTVLLQPTPLAAIAWLLPSVAAAGWWLVARLRLGSYPRPAALLWQTYGEWRAVILGLVIGTVPIALNWRRVPLGTATDSSFLDLYFLQALSNGLARFGAGESILMTGGSLKYHWLSYAWVGEMDQMASLPVFAGLTRVLPVVALIGVSAVTARWAAILARGSRYEVWGPIVAVALVVAGGYTGALYGAILNFDSPSQTMTTLWLLGLLFAIITYLQSGRWWILAVIALLASASMGGKVSHIAVAAGGLGILVVVGLLTRRAWRWRAVVAAALSGVAAVVTYALVIRGAAIDRNLVEEVAVKASTWQGLDPLPGTWGILAGTIALVLAAFARLAGMGWLARERSWRTDPSFLLAAGGIGVGVVALLALRDGINETWFLLAASAPGAVVSSIGVIAAVAFLRDKLGMVGLRWAAVLAVVTALPALVLSLNSFGEEFRPFAHWAAAWLPWLVAGVGSALVAFTRGSRPGMSVAVALAVVALVSSSVLTRPSVWWTSQREVFTETADVVPEAFASPGEPISTPRGGGLSRVEVADALRELADAEDVVFTTDSVSAFVPAFTALQMYLAGDRYQFGLGAAGDVGELRDRQTAIATVLADPTQAVAVLCPAGVDWLWWQGDVPTVLRDQVAITGEDVGVVDLRDECAGVSTS